MAIHRFSGQVVDKVTSSGVDSLRVEARVVGRRAPGVVAAAITNERGEFALEMSDVALADLFQSVARPLYFRVVQADTDVLASTERTLRWLPNSDGSGRIQVDTAVSLGPVMGTERYTVEGIVGVNAEDTLGEALTVNVFERLLQLDGTVATQLLATTTTDAFGRYAVSYPPSEVSVRPDLVVEARSGATLVATNTLCKAPARAVVDVVEGGADGGRFPGMPLFHTVKMRVDRVLDELGRGTPLTSVTSAASRDHIACRGDLTRGEVDALADAAILNGTYGDVTMDVFFAILLRGTTREAFFRYPLAHMRTILEEAVATRVIAPRTVTALDDLIDTLELAAFDELSIPGTTGLPVGQLAAITPGITTTVKRNALISHTLRNEDSDEDFWDVVSRDTTFSADDVSALRFSSDVARISGFWPGTISKLHALRAPGGTARDLADYTPANWTAVVNDSGFPPGTPGADTDAKKANYALQLADEVDKRFRTAFLAGKYKAGAASPLKTFFINNPTIDFRTKRARRYFHDTATPFAGLTAPEAEAVKRDLLAYERLQMVTMSYAESEALFLGGLSSANLIHAKGKGALMAPPFNLSAPVSEAIYAKACWTTAAAVAVHAKFSQKYDVVSAMVLPNKAVSTALAGFSSVIPDWAELFGALDQCACEHCRSVLSPSAYLVDVVNLLDRFGSPTAKARLMGRRPDLARLVLSCRNTQTILPYVDLVNEILEVKVATTSWPSAPARVESVGGSKQLQAHPELAYALEHFQAYVALADALHPLSSPFHLWIEEARVYLEHLGVSWHTLVEKLAVTAGVPNARLLAMERLGLAPKQYDIVAGLASPPAWQLWGYAVEPGSLVTALSGVRNLLLRAGMTYEELREILYAKVDSNAAFPPTAPCTLQGLTLIEVDTTFFDNVQRLLRLQRQLRWSLSDLAKIIPAFPVTWSARMQALGAVVRLRARTGLEPAELLAWYGNMDTQAAEAAPSLFEALFLSRFVLNPDQQVFATVFASGAGTGSVSNIEDYGAGMQSGLRIDAADFRLLTDADTSQAELVLVPAVPGADPLNLANISRLFRIASCARALRLTIRELLSLRELAGDKVLTGDTGEVAVPEGTLTFFDKVDKLGAAGFTVDELSYLLRHVAPAKSGLEPSDSTFEQWDAAVLAGVKTAANEALHVEDPTGTLLESLGTELLLAADALTMKHLAEKHPSLSKDAANTFLAGPLAPYLDSVSAAQAALVGGTGSGTVAGALSVVDERRTYLAQRLQRFVNSAAFVKNWAAATFELDQAAADRFLSSGAISRPTMPTIPALFALLPASVWDQAAESDQGKRKEIFVRLQKAALLTRKLKLTPAELEQFYPDGGGPAVGGLPQLVLNSVPTARPTSTTVIAAALTGFEAVLGLVDYARVRSAFNGAEPLLVVFNLAETAAMTVVFDALASATGWNRNHIDGLATRFGYTTAASFRNQIALARLLDAIPLLQRVGASATQAIAWETDRDSLPNPAATESGPSAYLVARDIKRLAKSKHSEAAWADIARPLRNVLRERQRATLVDRMTGVNKTKEQLFQELLIDVEMSPCQLTSRMVLAHGTVQLFMGQILMGLEGSLEPNADIAREWRWMKNYRVWEANRKVFLWPENWIEPELRDNKTPLFKELETKLLQGTLDVERAEDAYRTYLEGLSDIANLEIMALHDAAAPPSPHFAAETTPTLHVFGKSLRNKKYYHRSRHDGIWSPWQKLDFDIDSQHLIPISIAGKLYLFWPQFTERLLPKEEGADSQEAETGFRFAFSELRASGWTAPSSCPDDAWFLGALVSPEALSFTAQKYNGAILIYTHVSDSTAYSEASYLDTVARLTFMPGVRRGHFRSMNGYEVPNAPAFSRPKAQVFELKADPPSFTIKFSREGEYPALHKLLSGAVSDFRVVFERNYEGSGGLAEHSQIIYQDDTRTLLFDLDRQYPDVPVLVPGPDPLNKFAFKQRYLTQIFHHPYVGLFQQQLALRGIDGLLRWADQHPAIQLETENIKDLYLPKWANVGPFPKEMVNFGSSPFGEYNWEFFFHAPFLIATRLMQSGRHAEAQKWLHYIFDPTDGKASLAIGPRQYWKVKPLYANTDLATIQEELLGLAESAEAEALDALNAQAQNPASDDLLAQIEIFRQDPFDPHAIARLRPVAYQKAIVLRYIENLIAWGDQLFSQDTMESVNEATQLYVLASQILGTKPTIIRDPNDHETKTLGDLDNTDAFSNQLTEVETFTPLKNAVPGICGVHPPVPTIVTGTLYFCVPPNEKLFGLWDLVADRLFKIRHCMNIEGVVRTLPLFQPPIDPALLVRATAAGIDIASVLYDLNTAAPPYRYSVLYAKAQEFVQSVVAHGSTLLSALEKQDVEHLANMRSQHEMAIQDAVREVRRSQLAEAKENLKGLQHTRAQAQLRLDFYSSRTLTSAQEDEALEQLRSGQNYQNIANGLQVEAGIAHAIGNIQAGIAAAVVTGGQFVGGALQAGASAAQFLGADASFRGATISTMAGYGRRLDDWKLQASVTQREIKQLESQILAAEIRVAVAEHERDVVERQITQSREADSFMRGKFTNEDLYGWMVGQLRAVYFQAYQLAYDMAKRAQSAFQYERGDASQTFISFGYWDGQKSGLLAGEKLAHDLRRMDAAYVMQNKRELELTKMVSLAEHDPAKLVSLRDTGIAELSLTEDDYDRDFADHYLRRIKTIAVSVPCVPGPYQGVLGTLTVLQGATRAKPGAAALTTSNAALQSIVTSQAQQDAGLFELQFRDERLLPFEGAGAHLPNEPAGEQIRFALSKGNRFDYRSIDDLVLDIRYTARAGRTAEVPGINFVRPVHRLVRVRDELDAGWAAFKEATSSSFILTLPPETWQRARNEGLEKVTKVTVHAWFASLPLPTIPTVTLTPPAGAAVTGSASGTRVEWSWTSDIPFSTMPTDWTLAFTSPETGMRSALDDLWIIFDYDVKTSS